jgi:hypothetical protein
MYCYKRIKLIKKNAPHIKWLLSSYADGNLCGDGTIYRASGFKLNRSKYKTQALMLLMPSGEVMCSLTSLAHSNNKKATDKVLVQVG